jgi:hypothetical protein
MSIRTSWVTNRTKKMADPSGHHERKIMKREIKLGYMYLTPT